MLLGGAALGLVVAPVVLAGAGRARVDPDPERERPDRGVPVDLGDRSPGHRVDALVEMGERDLQLVRRAGHRHGRSRGDVLARTR